MGNIRFRCNPVAPGLWLLDRRVNPPIKSGEGDDSTEVGLTALANLRMFPRKRAIIFFCESRFIMSDTAHSGNAFLRFLIRWFVFCSAMVTRAKLQIRHRLDCIFSSLRSPAFWVRQGAGRAWCALVGMP